MRIYRPNIWNQYRSDEFALNDKRHETIQAISAAVATWTPNTIYAISTNADFGEYDFSAKKYDFHPLAENTVFTVSNCCTKFPNQLQVTLYNPDIIDGLPMDLDRAKQFLRKRQSGGYVNRQVTLVLTFCIASLTGDDELQAHIIRAEVLDPANAYQVIFTVTGTPAR